jgi:Zn-dependent protease with chaperone function
MQKPPDPNDDRNQARQARLAAFVIAGTAVLWMGAQWLGSRMGWETRYVFLFDLAAIAAFIWAMVVTYQIWRKRRT